MGSQRVDLVRRNPDGTDRRHDPPASVRHDREQAAAGPEQLAACMAMRSGEPHLIAIPSDSDQERLLRGFRPVPGQAKGSSWRQRRIDWRT